MADVPVAHEPFELAHQPRGSPLMPSTHGPFALRLLRADAAADRRQRTVLRAITSAAPATSPSRRREMKSGICTPTGQAATQRGLRQCRQRRRFESVPLRDCTRSRPLRNWSHGASDPVPRTGTRGILFAMISLRFERSFICRVRSDGPARCPAIAVVGGESPVRASAPVVVGTSPDGASPRRNRRHDRRIPARRRR